MNLGQLDAAAPFLYLAGLPGSGVHGGFEYPPNQWPHHHVTLCGQGPDSGLCYREGAVLREFRFMALSYPTLVPLGESFFSGPQPSHLSNGIVLTQPCSRGSWVSKERKDPAELSPDGRGYWLLSHATCLDPSWCLSGPFLFPFLVLGKSQITSPGQPCPACTAPRLISLQLLKCPRQALGSSQWWPPPSQGSRPARWAAGTGGWK